MSFLSERKLLLDNKVKHKKCFFVRRKKLLPLLPLSPRARFPRWTSFPAFLSDASHLCVPVETHSKERERLEATTLFPEGFNTLCLCPFVPSAHQASHRETGKTLSFYDAPGAFCTFSF